LAEPTKQTKQLNYNHLSNLKKFSLTYYNPLRPLARNYPELVQNVVDFLMPTIPSVQVLSLSFSILSMNNHSTDLEDIFARHNFAAIDDFLADSLPPNLKLFKIHIDVVVSVNYEHEFIADEIKTKGRQYARGFFPRLSKLPYFCIFTEAFVCKGVINRQHYSSHPGYNWEYPGGITE
jgi:hypothetical protein